MKPFQGLRAVSFDVGGTLIDPWPSVGHVYAAVALEAGLPQFDPVRLNKQFAAAWRSKVNFDYSRAAWADLVASTFGGTAAEYGVASAFFQRLYDRFTEARAWKIYDDVVPTLQALAKHGLKLAVISNWDDRLRPLLRNLDLDRHFDLIVVSAESGWHKPAPEVFLRAVAALKLSPGEVLHVGDTYLEDYRGAEGAGLKSVLLKRGSTAGAPAEIGSLSELTELIR